MVCLCWNLLRIDFLCGGKERQTKISLGWRDLLKNAGHAEVAAARHEVRTTRGRDHDGRRVQD